MRRLLLLLSFAIVISHAQAPGTDPLNLTVKASVSELLDGYGHLDDLHPDKASTGKTTYPLPTIDLYDPSGKLSWFGGDSAGNSMFIARLPDSLGKYPPPGPKVFRPDLNEALTFFHELSGLAKSDHLGQNYTLIAVSYPNEIVQNNAIAKLMSTKHPGLRVVRVFLHV